MRKITLITGGCRSGKSAYALSQAMRHAAPRAFLATCPRMDDEMAARIERHQKEREADQWHTVEEETNLSKALTALESYPVIVLDCLTLWINNLLYHQGTLALPEERMAELTEEFVTKCETQSGHLIVVTNETGLGITPTNDLARHFRDLVGRCNQIFASRADQVVLMVSGIPVTIKAP
ncbi:bifunctional adenosylcobinamide kinase/adenosylcobinamide-phosphate guanylyltransferase [Sulfidibacter corallicola]|uniref:Adenosylcobinamide kinase n=1 Tax=Sulfidibacter corallicola TaxID=2818388 RepID=A0A8A4TGB5_SULCO|nr:bifunctional adenosylcobinamide kinase/adenosylcobinamide-phosphate guanylyltransferase [Sulfidibacter corallicola]QTD47768.1 bifunctional adenosylcobinamide kinase/adenosylcobinamide-phosphate guanylyltransferase [Sulfidibacter corallicola]